MPNWIQRKRAKENLRRLQERQAKRRERAEAKAVVRAWQKDYETELETARTDGERALRARFGKSTGERRLEQEAQHARDDKDWSTYHIARLLGPARLRKISVIDGEWKPPTTFKTVERKAKGKGRAPTRKISEPIEPRLFGCYDGHQYRRYADLAELVKGELTAANKGRWFFAHNGGKADFLFFLREILKPADGGAPKYEVSQAMAGSRILFLTIKKGGLVRVKGDDGVPLVDDDGAPIKRWRTKHTWTFCDSAAIFQMTLAKLGKSISGKKGEGKGESARTVAYLKQRWGKSSLEDLSQKQKQAFYRSAPDDVLAEYNEQDCKILWRALHNYQLTLLRLGGALYKTGAATALNLFRRAYLRRDIRTDSRDNDLVEYGDAYIASRVEPFRQRMGGKKFPRRWRSKPAGYSHDINSSFATSMLRPLPAEFEEEERGVPVDEFVSRFDLGAKKGAGPRSIDDVDDKRLRDNPVLLADLDVEVPEVSPANARWSFVPPLPVRTHDRHIFFPHGRWRALFTTPDIELLLQYGGKISTVHRVWRFASFTDHRDYALDIFKLRKKAIAEGSPDEIFYKLLLNALYGKYGEHEVKEEFILNPTAQQWEDYGDGTTVEHVDPFSDEKIQEETAGLRQVFQDLCVLERRQRLPHRHTIISAYITADARARLTRWLWAAEERGKIFYGDTDSCRCSTQLRTGAELGDLKAEAIIERADFRQPKLYRMRGWDVKGDWEKKGRFDTIKAKGFRSLEPEEYQQLVEGKGITQRRMVTLREALDYLNEAAGAGGELEPEAYLPRESQFIKETLEPEIPKRKKLPHGETRPWTVDELLANGMQVRPHAGSDGATFEPVYAPVRGLAEPRDTR